MSKRTRNIKAAEIKAAEYVIRNIRAYAKEMNRPIDKYSDQQVYEAWREAAGYECDNMDLHIINILNSD